VSATTIVIADDHAVVRSGLRMLLDAEPDFHVVADAASADEAWRCLQERRPAVLVLDLHMPGGNSIAWFPALRRASPATRIVVLTMQDDPGFAREAMGAGATGFVLKESADTELVRAVRSVAEGGSYLDPAVGGRLLTEPPHADGSVAALTEREVDVLRLLALGHTNGEIAGRLYLSVRTVETHRASIQRKLELPARADLVRYALERRLIGP
jgi:two-component system, NarL family, response regulator NreC